MAKRKKSQRKAAETKTDSDSSVDDIDDGMVSTSKAHCCFRLCPLIFWLLFFALWYAAFIAHSVFVLETYVERIMYAIPWNILIIMIFWSLGYASYYGPSAEPPDKYYIDKAICRKPRPEWNAILETIIQERGLNASYDLIYGCQGRHSGPCQTSCLVRAVNFCQFCRCIKPPRCHHCRQCGQCVLRMDHHCPVVGTCVGYQTHKAFLLYLIYSNLLAIYGFAITLQYVPGFWMNGSIYHIDKTTILVHVAITCCSVCGLANLVPVGGFLMFHLQMASHNRTTLECNALDTPERAWKAISYDLERWPRNLRAVFGDYWPYWFLPLNTMQSVDGTDYPQQTPHYNGQPPA